MVVIGAADRPSATDSQPRRRELEIECVFGGLSPEHDISILTGLQAAHLLRDAGTDVSLIYWTKQARFESVPSDAEAEDFAGPERAGFSAVEFTIPGGFVEPGRRRSRPLDIDVVLNCCHGGPGEDGGLDSLLRLAGMRVTGPNARSCAVSMDKLATTAVADAIGIETIPSTPFEPGAEFAAPFGPPWAVKPRFGGSSIGVEVGVDDVATIRALSQGASARSGLVVQPYLEGWVDLNIAVRTYPRLQVSAIERPLSDGVYDYATKYLSGAEGMESAPRELPADLPSGIRATIEDAAGTLAGALQISGAPRVDFLWDGDGTVLLNEINPIPGVFGLYLWSGVGVDRVTLLTDLLTEAENQPVHPGSWNPASDGAALRSARDIATKLA
ncbi:D-alanine--D-alanine ligase family protein [Candidatus Poriferisocius sp.]|uniref:D-alanine--D-alanine ligase family protein n=1 Tax=Candidatus Poriferisocius sp. TaxID=3101276 RepID=UPI003B010F6F